MVRIIGNEKLQEPKELPKLTQASNVLLQVIGIIIADNPRVIKELLEDYSVELSGKPGEKELADKLLYSICEGSREFNNDLAALILDCTIESGYDNFDFKSLFGKAGESKSEEGGESSDGAGGGGLIGGITSAIGGIGNAVGKGFQRKQAKDQASAQTLQGIYAYKAQLASNEQSKSKTKRYMLIGLFVLLGLGLVALAGYMKKQSHQSTPLKT